MNRFSDTPLRDHPGFRGWYGRHLAHLDIDQETARARAWRASLIRGAVALAVVVALIAGGLFLYVPSSPFAQWLAIAATFLVLLVLVVWVIDPARNQAEVTKARVIPAIIAWFGDFRFASETDFPLGNVQDWALMPEYSEVSIGDVVEGSRRGVPLRFAELELIEEYDSFNNSGSSRTRNRVFDGLFAEYGLPSPIPALTVFLSRGAPWTHVATRNGWTALDSGHEAYEAWTAGDPGAALPFPESLPDVLTGMALGLGAKHVAAVFEGQRLVVLLQGASDVFEPAVMRAADLYDQAERLRRQLGHLLTPVEDLPVAASVPVRDEPAPVDQATNDATADGKVDRFGEGPGCLFLIIGSTVAFLAYGFALRHHELPGVALLTGLVGGVFIAWTAWDLLEARRAKPVPWFGSLFRLAVAFVPLWFLLR